MSRDLSFWKYRELGNATNKEIYYELSQGRLLDCLEEIPVDQIFIDFKNEFFSWRSQDDKYYENNNEAFQLMITKQFVRVDCYNLTEYNMNKIIDIMLKYECPLYDAAIDVRFDENFD